MHSSELKALLALIDAIGAGNLEHRESETTGTGEYADLVEHLNRMAENLEARFLKQTENLSQSEQSYREIFNSATDMIFIQDLATGAFIDVNEETVRASGYSLEEYQTLGVELFSPKSPEYAPERALGHVQKAAGGEPQLFEWAFVDKAGLLHPTEVHLKRTTINGKPCLLGITRDITNRKAVEVRQKELEERILRSQRLESLGLLAGGIAHDFNNILTGILGLSSLALMNLQETAPARRHIVQVEKAASRAAELVKQMLSFTGSEPQHCHEADLSILVEEIGQLLSTVVSRKAQVTFELAPDLPPVMANVSALHQVIMNIITNASEALQGEVGTIAIRTGMMELSRAELASTFMDWDQSPGQYCYLEVVDAGVGIDKELLPRIFDPFYTSKTFGRGLGLASVLGIVRSLGGAIDVRSGPGKGTSFQVFLPACSGTSRTATPDTTPVVDQPPFKGCVLVVDDDDIVLEAATEFLAAYGVSAMVARHGREALCVYEENRERIVAVLLDVRMPVMDGPETLREMRSRGWDVPVLLSSGYSAFQASAADSNDRLHFIAKPYTPAQLIKAIREAVGGLS
jgi:two-component system, cell cycle sensor histidine kinase and response regulator CckA